jgi:hypothetical protein
MLKFKLGQRVVATRTIHKGAVGTIAMIPSSLREGKRWVYVQRDDRVSPTWFFEDELEATTERVQDLRARLAVMQNDPTHALMATTISKLIGEPNV